MTLGLVARSDYIWGARSIFPVLVQVAALCGDDAHADHLLARWEAAGVGQPRVVVAAALAELGREQHARSLVDVDRRWTRPASALNLGSLAAHAELCVALRETAAVESLLAALEPVWRRGVALPCDGTQLIPRLLGDLYALCGDAAGARRRLEEAHAVATRTGLRTELGRTDLALARVHAASGDGEQALLHARAACAVLDEIGLSRVADRALADPLLAGLAPARRRGGVPRVRTVLITDMVSSTSVNASLGDEAWLALIGAHDRLIRGVLAAHGGVEFNHTGDGIAAWFAEPGPAATTAIELQARFARQRVDEPTRSVHIRIGIATGRPIDHDRRVLGVDVARTTRITAAAAPDETLLDATTAEQLDAAVFTMTEAGEVELRGLPGRHRLLRLVEHA